MYSIVQWVTHLRYPFIVFDLIKIVAATFLGKAVRYALVKAGLLSNDKVVSGVTA